MQMGEQIALSQFWFAWNDATTRKVLLAVVLERFSTIAERTFQQNQLNGQCPTNWEGFEALRRNPRNVRRMIGGEHGTTIEFLVGAAAMLRVDVREFFPETVEWVAQATLQLVAWNRTAMQYGTSSNGRERTERIEKRPTYSDARTYAEFLLKHPPCSKTASEVMTIRNRLQSLEPDLSESIRTITASISRVLAERDAVVKQREEAR